MRKTIWTLVLTTTVFGGSALAQSTEGKSVPEREQRAETEAKLQEARARLEQAAREVAQLSEQFAGGLAMRGFGFGARRSMLGINIEDAEQGVRVAGVSPNGPAAEAGVKVGDTITAIDGAALADGGAGASAQSPSARLVAELTHVKPGEEVTLRVLRDGKAQDIKLSPREFSPRVFVNALPTPPMPSLPQLGWFWRSNPWSDLELVAMSANLGQYFGTDKGLLVVHAPGDEKLQLRDGDVILDIGGREPTSPEHALRILGSFQEGEKLSMTIMRNQRRQTLEFSVPAQEEN